MWFDDVTNDDIIRLRGARDVTGTRGVRDITWVLGPSSLSLSVSTALLHLNETFIFVFFWLGELQVVHKTGGASKL
eukprot:13033369-Ditylum_brightwellii.AAC.1